MKQKNNKATLIGALIALVVVVIVVVAIVWLRGCSPGGTSSAGRTTGQPSASSAGTSTTPLEDRIHAALHAQTLSNGNPLDTLVYIFEVSTDNGVAVTITLTQPSAAFARTPSTNPQKIAAACENAVLAAVPEVTSVAVVDTNHVPISLQKRK